MNVPDVREPHPDGRPLDDAEIDAVCGLHGVALPDALRVVYRRGDGGRIAANWVESSTAQTPGTRERGVNCPIERFIPLTGETTMFTMREELVGRGLAVGDRYPFADRGRAYSYWFDASTGEVMRLRPKGIDQVRGTWLHFADDVSTFLTGLNHIEVGRPDTSA